MKKAFSAESTRKAEELTGNITLQRGIARFTEGVSQVFRRMAIALKPGAPLAFTFHHNALAAYESVAVAILDAGLTCSATLPSPAEMGGSIHIAGTDSSIIDSIFVCRSTGKVKRSTLSSDAVALDELVKRDLQQLQAGGVAVTRGDCRCIAAGHLSRLAIWHLRHTWQRELPVLSRLAVVSEWMKSFGGLDHVLRQFDARAKLVGNGAAARINETPPTDWNSDAEFVSF